MNIDQMEKWHFDITEKAANELLALVLKGKKRATSSSLRGYEKTGERVPQADDMSVITDWSGTPGCVIRTTRVRIIPYNEITFDTARLEGEDEDLSSWQRTHQHFFEQEGKEIGYLFSEDMPVVFEEFEVVEVLQNDHRPMGGDEP